MEIEIELKAVDQDFLDSVKKIADRLELEFSPEELKIAAMALAACEGAMPESLLAYFVEASLVVLSELNCHPIAIKQVQNQFKSMMEEYEQSHEQSSK